MPILFGTLAALVLAISAWMGYKNKDEFKKQISARRAQEHALEKKHKTYEERVKELEKEIQIKEALVVENKELSETLAGITSEMETIKSEMATKEQKINVLKEEVEEANAALQELGDTETLVPKIRRLRDDIAQLKDDQEKEEVNLANLKQVKKTTQVAINTQVAEAEKIAEGKSQARLSTTIKTVYSNWGFVTLNGGDAQGVVPGSTLDVMRGGEVVAKLVVTTVEPNRAAADIIRDSLKDGQYLQSGDKVKAEVEIEVEKPKVVNLVKPKAKVKTKEKIEPIDDIADPADLVDEVLDEPFGEDN